jgi:HAD superfamily phosphoserine phosphatase-like hydrolase
MTAMSRLLVVMDFDGTITTGDCLDSVLRRHTQGWPGMLERVARLEIGRVQALKEQIGQLHLPRQQVLAEFAAAAAVRPGFGSFLRWLAAGGSRTAVISLGLTEGIAMVWQRESLPPVRVYGSELRSTGTNLEIEVSDALGDCPTCGRGACKGQIVRNLRHAGDLVVACGDGTADICMAREANLTFARGSLAAACEREHLNWQPLSDFNNVRAALSTWLAAHSALPPSDVGN